MFFVFEKLLEREKSWNFDCWCEKSPCQVALNFFQAIFQVLYDLFHGLLHTSQFNKHGLDFAMTLQRLCPDSREQVEFREIGHSFTEKSFFVNYTFVSGLKQQTNESNECFRNI